MDRMLQSMKAAGFCQQTRTVRVRGFYPSRVHVLRVATLASDGGAVADTAAHMKRWFNAAAYAAVAAAGHTVVARGGCTVCYMGQEAIP